MNFDFGAFNNWGTLKKVAIRDVDQAFINDAKIDAVTVADLATFAGKYFQKKLRTQVVVRP